MLYRKKVQMQKNKLVDEGKQKAKTNWESSTAMCKTATRKLPHSTGSTELGFLMA